MSGSSEWAAHCSGWFANRAAAKVDASVKSLKDLCPSDAKRVFGHGLQAIRTRAGSLSLKELVS